MAEYGLLQEIQVQVRDTSIAVAASVSDTELLVDNAGDFSNEDADEGGVLSLNGALLEYTGVEWGIGDEDPDTIFLAAPLAVAADVGDDVAAVIAGLVAEDWWAVVDHGGGDVMVGPLNTVERAAWAPGPYDPPVPVMFSEDLTRLEDAPGRPTSSGGRVQAWDQDMLVLEGPGEVALALTHTPLPMSLLAFWGTQFIPITERSLSGNLLTVEDSDEVFGAGEVISAWYLYDGAAPATPEAPAPGPLLAFESSGWKWLQIGRTDATDYSAPAFDDSAWATASAAFGDPPTSPGWASRGWPNGTTQWDIETRMWARRTITAVGGADINVTLRADRTVTMWLDGVEVYNGIPNGVEQTFTIDGADVPSGSSVLAVRITDESSSLGCYFDMEATQ